MAKYATDQNHYQDKSKRSTPVGQFNKIGGNMQKLKIAALAFVFLWFMSGGIYHFINADFFLNIMPPYLPFHLAAVYVSGVFEILGALGLLFTRSRRPAGIGLFILTIAVSPANIYMWMNPDLFPDISEPLLAVRLLIQVLLLACIWWSSLPAMTSIDAALKSD
jgi:uncharacterized membrane protein